MARLSPPRPAGAALGDLLSACLPAGVARTVNTLARAQKLLDASLPAALRGLVGVVRLQPDLLTLACASGAVASHLRHRIEPLRIALRERGLDVNLIDLKVAPERLPTPREPVERPGLPAAALRAMETLRDQTEAGPMREALERLLRRHRG